MVSFMSMVSRRLDDCNLWLYPPLSNDATAPFTFLENLKVWFAELCNRCDLHAAAGWETGNVSLRLEIDVHTFIRALLVIESTKPNCSKSSFLVDGYRWSWCGIIPEGYTSSIPKALKFLIVYRIVSYRSDRYLSWSWAPRGLLSVSLFAIFFFSTWPIYSKFRRHS